MQHDRYLGSFNSGKLNLLLNLNRVPLKQPTAARFLALPSVYYFFCSFVGDYIQTSTDDVPWMMSSSANYRPYLSSFRHIPPQESFVKLAN